MFNCPEEAKKAGEIGNPWWLSFNAATLPNQKFQKLPLSKKPDSQYRTEKASQNKPDGCIYRDTIREQNRR
jgi:hypothetical protein